MKYSLEFEFLIRTCAAVMLHYASSDVSYRINS